MKLAAQIVIAVLFAVSLLSNLHDDINGRKAKDPSGFAGVVVTLIVTAVAMVLYAYAGAFSEMGVLP